MEAQANIKKPELFYFMPNKKIYFYKKHISKSGTMVQTFMIQVGLFSGFKLKKFALCKYFGNKPINEHKKITFKFLLDVWKSTKTNNHVLYLKVVGFNQ